MITGFDETSDLLAQIIIFHTFISLVSETCFYQAPTFVPFFDVLPIVPRFTLKVSDIIEHAFNHF